MVESHINPICLTSELSHPAVKIKKPIQTKFRMPVLNWVALKPSQINGTVFNDIDDESILQVSSEVRGQASRHPLHAA